MVDMYPSPHAPDVRLDGASHGGAHDSGNAFYTAERVLADINSSRVTTRSAESASVSYSKHCVARVLVDITNASLLGVGENPFTDSRHAKARSAVIRAIYAKAVNHGSGGLGTDEDAARSCAFATRQAYIDYITAADALLLQTFGIVSMSGFTSLAETECSGGVRLYARRNRRYRIIVLNGNVFAVDRNSVLLVQDARPVVTHASHTHKLKTKPAKAKAKDPAPKKKAKAKTKGKDKDPAPKKAKAKAKAADDAKRKKKRKPRKSTEPRASGDAANALAAAIATSVSMSK